MYSPTEIVSLVFGPNKVKNKLTGEGKHTNTDLGPEQAPVSCGDKSPRSAEPLSDGVIFLFSCF